MPTKTLCYNCFSDLDGGGGPCPYCGFDLLENEQKYPIALRAGTVLDGRYLIGRVLGQGGFGITYLALDQQLGIKVAVKEFLPSEIAGRTDGSTVSVYAGDKTDDFTYGAERFLEEARTLAKFVGNPNIAGVSSYFDENGTSYFVMDYIEGISFKSYIANHGGKVSVEDTLNVMIPVLNALTAVHREGFIHRDVTPDNIYITKDGMVKLLDFGSARYSLGDKSKSLDVILKVGYAPKEQYIRRGKQGPYTDVYSCAACFYAAITGFLPPESLERLDHDDIASISGSGIAIPAYLESAIMKGLAVQAEDRFQSAEEFLYAIETQQIVEPVVSAASVPQAPAAPAKKKPKLAVIGGIAAVCVAAVIGLVVLLGGGEEPAVQASGQGGDAQQTTKAANLLKAEVPSITIAGEEYSTDLQKLTFQSVGLTDADLEPLKYMINLNSLDLRGNEISDLSPIAGLTGLTYLELRDNAITDLSALSELTELRTLTLRNNAISDLSPLRGMTKMESLQISGNADISDLSPLSGMTAMASLTLPATSDIASLAPLAGLTQLTSLSMDGSDSNYGQITDLSPLAGMTKLTTLYLTVGEITDISPLAGLTELERLSLQGHFNVEDVSPLKGLTKLREIGFHTNGNSSSVVRCQDMTVFSGMAGLTTLRGHFQVDSLAGLENLTELTELRLWGDGGDTEDLSPLKNLTKLKSLNMRVGTLDGLEGLENLTELTELNLWGNNSVHVSDFKALSGMTKLKSIQMQVDGLESLDGLETLTELTTIYLYGQNATYSNLDALTGLTKIKELNLPSRGEHAESLDISGIAGLTQLQSLQLDQNIKDLTPLSGLSSLKSLNINGGYGYNGDGRTRFSTLEPLRSLTGLTELSANTFEVTDISPLGDLVNLRSLYLITYKVTDISALSNLTGLQSASIYDYSNYNQKGITDWSPVEHVPNLQTNQN